MTKPKHPKRSLIGTRNPFADSKTREARGDAFERGLAIRR